VSTGSNVSPATTVVGTRNVNGNVLWLDPAAGAPRVTARPALKGEIDAEFCIVGGGFLGLWTALKLLAAKPDADIVLLEAKSCGFGASGRNAGFAMTMWSKAASLTNRATKEDAARLARASERALTEIEELCTAEGIDCGFQMPGWLWTASAPAQVGSWSSSQAAIESLGGEPFQLLSAAEARERLGTDNVFGAVFEERSATVDPGRLVLGLRDVALRRGVRIFENSPVKDIDRREQVVSTLGGAVRSRQLVLATNAWLARLPELRRVIVPVSADAVATEPVPAFLETNWERGEAWTNSGTVVDFARPTSDRRVVFGRGAAAIAFRGRIDKRFFVNPPRTLELTTALMQQMPRLFGADVTHSWSGPVARTQDGLPIIGRLPGSQVLFCAGFSGNGVGPAVVFGEMLASLALRMDDAWTASSYLGIPKYRFPPDPVRYVGALMVRDAVRRQMAASDAGRRTTYVTRRLAELGPTGLMKVK
jgi:glycine/D-amino acid oxidase-like deaminating enzyme